MRSITGIKSAPPSLVVFVTKSTIAFLELPSFQDGSGSAGGGVLVWSAVAAGSLLQLINSMHEAKRIMMRFFICESFFGRKQKSCAEKIQSQDFFKLIFYQLACI